MLVQTEFPEDIIFLPFRIPIFVKHNKFQEQAEVEIALACYIEEKMEDERVKETMRAYVA